MDKLPGNPLIRRCCVEFAISEFDYVIFGDAILTFLTDITAYSMAKSDKHPKTPGKRILRMRIAPHKRLTTLVDEALRPKELPAAFRLTAEMILKTSTKKAPCLHTLTTILILRGSSTTSCLQTQTPLILVRIPK